MGVVTALMDEVSTPGPSLSGTWVPPVVLDEPGGVGNHDLAPSCADHAVLAQLAQDPNDDLPSRPDSLRELPLADLDHKLGSRRRSEAGSGNRSDARSSRCRATRWRTVANALPEISQTKLRTRSLTSPSRAVATRGSRSAARRAAVGDILSSSASTSAWVGAGIAYPCANSDAAPMSAPGRQ
jgi:hypothetical protein